MSEPSILRVGSVEAACAPHRWVWAEEEATAIATHWVRRAAERSGLFNGRILMIADNRIEADVMRVRFFETDYANLLAWIEFGYPDESVANGFGMGALRADDGAFVLGVMGDHTANAGRVYFPCGTPDRSDVAPDGGVDLAASATRELFEETGLTVADYRVGDGWAIVRHRGLMAFLKPLDAFLSGEELRTRMLAHLAAQAEPELADIRLVCGEADIDEDAMPGFLPIFLRWAMAERAGVHR